MSVFTLLIDVDNKQILSNRFGGVGSLPYLDRGDTASFEIGFLKYTGIQYDFLDYSNSSIKVGIGVNSATPTDGQFKLTWNGVTSNAISYNATTAQIQTALAPAVSASVATISGVDSAWVITMTTAGVFAGTTAGFGGDSFTLFPDSSVLISTNRVATSGIQMKQVVRLLQSPAAFQDSWSNAPVTGGATLTLTQEGSASQSETYSLEIDDSVYSGQYNLIFGNQTASVAYNATAEQIQSELATLSSIGVYSDANGVSRPNVRVSGSNGKYGIAFVGNLSQTNITTALALNDSALYRPPYKTASITLGTSQIESLLNSGVTGMTLEVEVTEGGKPNTVLRTAVTFNQNDIIIVGSAIPAAQSSYYTKTEADALFVEDSTSNVDAANRKLKNSGGTTIVDYGASLFGASGMVNLSGSAITIGAYPVYIGASVTATGAVSFGGGMAVSGNLGFYGTAPTSKGTGINIANSITKSGIISFTQPTEANVVSNVISLGLIPSSPTYGVLPGSIKTITTSVTLSFGNIPSNDTTSLNATVTGANINDIVLLGLPTSLCAGLSFYGHVTSNDVIEIDAVNATNSSKNQSDQTYRITVIGY